MTFSAILRRKSTELADARPCGSEGRQCLMGHTVQLQVPAGSSLVGTHMAHSPGLLCSFTRHLPWQRPLEVLEGGLCCTRAGRGHLSLELRGAGAGQGGWSLGAKPHGSSAWAVLRDIGETPESHRTQPPTSPGRESPSLRQEVIQASVVTSWDWKRRWGELGSGSG